MVIGDSDDPEEVLAQVRQARRFSGGYVVTTGLPVGIRTFDDTGRFIRWIGRQGRGPGEFRSATEMWVTEGDTIIVSDRWENRVTYLNPNGDLIRTVRYESGGSFNVGDSWPRVIAGRFPDGSFLAVQPALPPPPEGNADEIVAGSARYFHESLDAGSRRLITETPTQDFHWKVTPGDPRPFWEIVPFSPSTAYAVVDSLIVLADSRRFEVAFWSTDGQAVGSFSKGFEARPVTDDVWAEELDYRLTQFTDRVESDGNRQNLNVQSELAAIRQRFREEARVPTLPAHGARMHADPSGNLWIQAWSDDPGERSRTWHIFLAESRRFVGTVELPPRFRPTAIYDDAVLGVQRDDWDVQTVREYRIIR